MKSFDVIIIGGGHAGCEAARACSALGVRTALVTMGLHKIGVMSCNPAIGGLAKGQLVKEIDALGGLQGLATDYSAIQYKQLNRSKGPAVRSSRAQCDKYLYAQTMQDMVGKLPNLELIDGEASRLKMGKFNKISGLELGAGDFLEARAVVVTTGTFLRGVMHRGESRDSGGRIGERAAGEMSQSLQDLGFQLRRLKTGTPPRVHRKSINFKKLEEQPGDSQARPISFYYPETRFPWLEQVSCFIGYTNPQTHEIIEENMNRSAVYSGAISGAGPRYCPSIEDKIKRFAGRERHQVFLEPEGLNTDEVYLNGISTSFPADVQEAFVRSIVGLENAEFIRYGYAVEYDAIDARQLKRSLESKSISGLFLAGQVNGTSGYEEAGGQGLIAGINAAHYALERDPFILKRHDGYIGVMIDDLTLVGSDEPYRMFTSRAEYRLLLREDNADLRLSERARHLGLLDDKKWARFERKRLAIDELGKSLDSTGIWPTPESAEVLGSKNMPALKDKITMRELLKRPDTDWDLLSRLGLDISAYDPVVTEQVEVQTKYEGYIKRDLEFLAIIQKNEDLKIPENLDFKGVFGLSNEIRGRLAVIRPETLGQMSRIQGVTPAAVANLLIHLRTKGGPNERPRI